MNHLETEALLNHLPGLQEHIQSKIEGSPSFEHLFELSENQLKNASVVLFLLSHCPTDDSGQTFEPCLILNKRSSQVRQGGDLCCPGGGLAWAMDNLLSRLLGFPGTPLTRWRRRYQSKPAHTLGFFPIMLACGLREAWEEMRLNPFRFKLLGLLPEQHLVMFDRVIYPLVGWVSPQTYQPNWEVERIVPITLRHLLDVQRYARFRPLIASGHSEAADPIRPSDFPCFIHAHQDGQEMLWGATYRITEIFLQRVFDFLPPESAHLPLVQRRLDAAYINGAG